MRTKSDLSFGVVVLTVCAFLLAGLFLGTATPASADSCLGSLHSELGTVLPSGTTCQSQGACSAVVDPATVSASTWIDAGTGIVSTMNSAAVKAEAAALPWMDAGARRISQAIAKVPAPAQANVWIDAGTGIVSTNNAVSAVAVAQPWMDAGARAPVAMASAAASTNLGLVTCVTTGSAQRN